MPGPEASRIKSPSGLMLTPMVLYMSKMRKVSVALITEHYCLFEEV